MPGPNENLQSTVSARIVRGLAELVEQLGFSHLKLYQLARLTPEQLEGGEARIPRELMSRLCECALDLTGDPALGLHWAERLRSGTFAPLSHLTVHAGSLRHAFATLSQFSRLLTDEPSYVLEERGDCAELRCLAMPGESLRASRFSAEMMVASFMRLIRGFDLHARIERVCFAYAPPSYRAEYERIFGGRAYFEQPFTGLVFDRRVLDVNAPHEDLDVHHALQSLAERRLMKLTRQVPYALRVRDYLVAQGWREGADMERVAQELDLSVRTLRRRLSDEGVSYGRIASEAMATVAKQLLRDPQRTIQEAAYDMGFSNASAFHRAFKRWTGLTPSTFQRRQEEG